MQESSFAPLAERLGEVVGDPAAWTPILDDVASFAGAQGAILLQTDIRTADVPRSSEGGMFSEYFAEGWAARDVRAERSGPAFMRGMTVITDHDILSPVEMDHSDLYQDLLRRHRLPWFAAVPFVAGSTVWGLVITRNVGQGAFRPDEKASLGRLSPRLAETAALSVTVGRAALAGALGALEGVGRPALSVDHLGRVLEANTGAASLLGPDLWITSRRLRIADPRAAASLQALLEGARWTPRGCPLPTTPILVQRSGGLPPLVLRPLSIDGPAAGPLLGARLILLLSEAGRGSPAQAEVLARAFGLSRAEARVAALVAEGHGLDRASDELRVGRETVRAHLRAVFAKTGVHRQAQLAALFARL